MHTSGILTDFFFGLLIAGAWVWTIVRIAKAEFQKEGQKTGWLVIVILLNYIGMIFYYLIGIKQIKKVNHYEFNAKGVASERREG